MPLDFPRNKKAWLGRGRTCPHLVSYHHCCFCFFLLLPELLLCFACFCFPPCILVSLYGTLLSVQAADTHICMQVMGKQETARSKANSALRKSSSKQKEADQDTVISMSMLCSAFTMPDCAAVHKKPTMKARKAQAAKPSNDQSTPSTAKPKEAIPPKPTASHKALLGQHIPFFAKHTGSYMFSDTRRSSVDSQASTAVESVQTASSVTLSGGEVAEFTTAKAALPSGKLRRSLLPSKAYGNKGESSNHHLMKG